MRAHIIESGVVINAIEVSDLNFAVGPGQLLVDGAVGGIGWRLLDGELVPPPEDSQPGTVGEGA